jgi:hypothetical protein
MEKKNSGLGALSRISTARHCKISPMLGSPFFHNSIFSLILFSISRFFILYAVLNFLKLRNQFLGFYTYGFDNNYAFSSFEVSCSMTSGLQDTPFNLLVCILQTFIMILMKVLMYNSISSLSSSKLRDALKFGFG